VKSYNSYKYKFETIVFITYVLISKFSYDYIEMSSGKDNAAKSLCKCTFFVLVTHFYAIKIWLIYISVKLWFAVWYIII